MQSTNLGLIPVSSEPKPPYRHFDHPVNVAMRAYFGALTPATESQLLSVCSDYLYKSEIVPIPNSSHTEIIVSGRLKSVPSGEDIANETIMQLWTKLPTYSAPADFTLAELIEQGYSTESAVKIIESAAPSDSKVPADRDLIPLLMKIVHDIQVDLLRGLQNKQILMGKFSPEEFQRMDYEFRRPQKQRGQDSADEAFEKNTDGDWASVESDQGPMGDKILPFIWGEQLGINYTRKNSTAPCERCIELNRNRIEAGLEPLQLPEHTAEEHFDNWTADYFNPGPPQPKEPVDSIKQYKISGTQFDQLMKTQADLCLHCHQQLPLLDQKMGAVEHGLVHAVEACKPDFIWRWKDAKSTWYPDRDTVLGQRLLKEYRSRRASASYRTEQSVYHERKEVTGGEQSARQRRINELEYIVQGSRFYQRTPEQLEALEATQFSFENGPGSKVWKSGIYQADNWELGIKAGERYNIPVKFCAAKIREGAYDIDHARNCPHSHDISDHQPASLITEPKPHELGADGHIQSVPWEVYQLETKMALGFWERPAEINAANSAQSNLALERCDVHPLTHWIETRAHVLAHGAYIREETYPFASVFVAPDSAASRQQLIKHVDKLWKPKFANSRPKPSSLFICLEVVPRYTMGTASVPNDERIPEPKPFPRPKYVFSTRLKSDPKPKPYKAPREDFTPSDTAWIRETLLPVAFGPQLEHRRSTDPIHPYIFSGLKTQGIGRPPYSTDRAIHAGTYTPFAPDPEPIPRWTPQQWLAYWQSRPQMWNLTLPPADAWESYYEQPGERSRAVLDMLRIWCAEDTANLEAYKPGRKFAAFPPKPADVPMEEWCYCGSKVITHRLPRRKASASDSKADACWKNVQHCLAYRSELTRDLRRLKKAKEAGEISKLQFEGDTKAIRRELSQIDERERKAANDDAK